MAQLRLVRFILTLCMAAVLIAPIVVTASPQKDEEELGRTYSDLVEKQCKLSTDPALTQRVERIGSSLARIANEYEVPARYGSSEIFKFRYRFKVVEDKDVNAFSLPGGPVYVNTGLLELVGSDDELAGVLAHEIAHAAHHHMVKLLARQSKVDRYVALIALAGILGNTRSRDLNNVLMGAQMVKIGKSSQYTMEAEKDADQTAVAYMAKSEFNPEGLLTFMKRLDALHDKNPSVTLGIFQTHPAPFRRVASITKAMQAAGLKLDFRKLRDAAYAKPVPVEQGSDRYEVVINGRAIYAPAAVVGGKSSKDRADEIAAAINAALDAGACRSDISVAGSIVLVRGVPVIEVTADDVALGAAGSEQAMVAKARAGLEYAVWANWLANDCAVIEPDSDDD